MNLGAVLVLIGLTFLVVGYVLLPVLGKAGKDSEDDEK